MKIRRFFYRCNYIQIAMRSNGLFVINFGVDYNELKKGRNLYEKRIS